MVATKRSPMTPLGHFRGRLQRWQELAREPGLTALLIIEASLVFVAVPLASMGVLPQMPPSKACRKAARSMAREQRSSISVSAR